MRLVSVSCENLTWKRREGDGSTLSSLTCLDMPVEGASSSSSQQTHDLQIEWIQRRLASAVTVSRNVIQTSICEFENVCNCLFHCKSKIDSLRPLFCTEYRHTRRLPTLIKSTLLIARSRSTPLLIANRPTGNSTCAVLLAEAGALRRRFWYASSTRPVTSCHRPIYAPKMSLSLSPRIVYPPQ